MMIFHRFYWAMSAENHWSMSLILLTTLQWAINNFQFAEQSRLSTATVLRTAYPGSAAALLTTSAGWREDARGRLSVLLLHHHLKTVWLIAKKIRTVTGSRTVKRKASSNFTTLYTKKIQTLKKLLYSLKKGRSERI